MLGHLFGREQTFKSSLDILLLIHSQQHHEVGHQTCHGMKCVKNFFYHGSFENSWEGTCRNSLLVDRFDN